MKKSIFFALAGLLTLTACNCNVYQVEGSYSFKTSGLAEITTATDTTMIRLSDETGMMDIRNLKSGDSILIVMNETNGSVFTIRAEVKDKVITFAPFERPVVHLLSTSSTTYLVTVSGSGRYTDGTIVFDLSYDGLSLDGNKTLTAPEIKTVATVRPK